ncbi:MAG: copper-binding protein [Acetobacteraceae bacterium]
MLIHRILASSLVASILALGACAPASPPTTTAAAPPVGIDLGAAPGRMQTAATAAPAGMPAPMASTHDHGGHTAQAGADGIPGHGIVDAIDVANRRVTISHEPMPALGWPAMTMVFPAPPSVDLGRVQPKDHVDFTLKPGSGGTYDLTSLQPAYH